MISSTKIEAERLDIAIEKDFRLRRQEVSLLDQCLELLA